VEKKGLDLWAKREVVTLKQAGDEGKPTQQKRRHFHSQKDQFLQKGEGRAKKNELP